MIHAHTFESSSSSTHSLHAFTHVRPTHAYTASTVVTVAPMLTLVESPIML